MNEETVPDCPPYGITDGSWICSRCGEAVTGCILCAGEVVSMRRYNTMYSKGDANE